MIDIDITAEVITCTDCGARVNFSAINTAQALRMWTTAHPCKPVPKLGLDEVLSTLRKHNVIAANLDANGNVLSVNFAHEYGQTLREYAQEKPVGLVSLAMQEFQQGADKNAAAEFAPPRRKISDIEFALNPPDDIKHPVDDGK